MKKLAIVFVALSLSKGIFSQNVGIGTTTPSSKLHVKGTGSGTQIVLEENAGSILRISNEPSGTGPYVGTTTNNPLSLVTNNSAKLTISTAGNIGIGQSSPTSPLHFSNTLGSKIALWGTNPNHYGIGIQSFQMQFYTPANTDDFVFGHGNSSSLTETMRIKGNGNIGIGTNNPLTTLDVNGDVNIENRLLLNNTAGNSRQVLMSNGNSSAPSWQNVAYSNNDRFYFKTDTGLISALPNYYYTIPKFIQVYAYSTAITQPSPSAFLVNKSGLYSIMLDLTITATKSIASESGLLLMLFNISFPSAPAYSERFYSGPIPNYVGIFGGHTYTLSVKKEWKIYLPAGSSFNFSTTGISSNVNTCFLEQDTGLSINLISE